MPLDPQMETILGLIKQSGLPEVWQLTPDQAREQYLMRVRKLEVKQSIFRTQDRRIPGPDSEIPIRVYWPREAKSGELFPVLLWLHGGGFVIGNLDTHDSVCRMLAVQGDCMVISVDYRLAPEFRFPAAVDDSHAVLRWLALHGSEIGVDAKRIAVGGDSAGGNLAAVLAILARDEGHPPIALQLLIYPCTAPEPETPSHHKFAEGYVLSRNSIVWFYKLDLDPAVSTPWWRFDYVVRSNLMAGNLAWLPRSRTVYDHSRIVAVFTTKDERIEIRRVVKPRGH